MNKSFILVLVAVIVLVVVFLGWGNLFQKSSQIPDPLPLPDTEVVGEGQVDVITDIESASEVKEVGSTRVESATDGFLIDLPPIKEFTVSGNNFSFSLSEIKVKKGDRVRIIFKNENGFHDFVLDEFKAATKKLEANKSETVEFLADKSGRFEYYCSVGSHRANGMKGVLVVE
jgi:plastocyanin